MNTQHSNCNNALAGAIYGHLMQSGHAPAILVADPADNYRVLYANVGAARLLGYSTEELQGMMVSDFVPTFSEDRGVKLKHLLIEKERIVFESLHKTRDGGIFPVELELSCFRYQERTVVMGVWRTIRLSKPADARLVERMRLEQQLSSLAASVPGCIFSIRVDADGHTSMPFASVGIADLFGLQPEDIREDAAPLHALYHPEDLPRHLAAVAQSSRDLTPFRSEVRASHPGLGERVIEIHSRPQREADGGTVWHGLMLDSTERRRMEMLIQHQASYDALTGLPNRRLFRDRLSEAIAKSTRDGRNVAILFIDLDHFKEINDTLGHDIGDDLLICAARRIGRCIRESDSVARLGADEFAVILPEVEPLTHLGHPAQHILDAIMQPFDIGTHTVHVSASIGIASFPFDADNLEALISAADQAMSSAKSQGRNTFSFFTMEMQQHVQERLSLANELREALIRGQLAVWLQPVVDIASGHITKAEALIRWRHPQRGMISPEEFIPIAEEMGLIHDIGDWVFREAALATQQWLALSDEEHAPDHQVSVNVSARQIARNGFAEAWIAYLDEIGLASHHIVIEIVERQLLNETDNTYNVLALFRDHGIQVALDDFGTGYSAMGYLKKFAIDYLKIDRSFIHDLENNSRDSAITEAIVVMARRLGVKTIAEGVENAAQCELLRAMGCDYAQGYFHARPMPVAEFLDFLGARRNHNEFG